MSKQPESTSEHTGTENSNYKITLYLDTPKMLLKPGSDTVYGQKFKGGVKDSTWYTGHAFIGLSDGKNEEKWGFGPDHAVVDSMRVYMTGCKSEFHREDDTHYNEAIVYPVSKEQYLAAKNKVEEYKKHPELEYKLFSRNCSTVSSSILKAAGVKTPPGKLTGLSPHGLTIKKRLLYLRRKIDLQLLKVKLKLQKWFGNKKISPRAAMLNMLRNKPLPIPVELGTKMGKKGGKIDEKQVLKFMLPSVQRA